MTSIKHLTVFFTILTIVLASPLMRRNGSTVITDISALSSDLFALDKAIKRFDGTATGAIPVANAGGALVTAIKKTINDSNASGTFSSEDSSSVTQAWTGLGSGYMNSLEDFADKKAAFQAAGLQKTILNGINNLWNLTDTLSADLCKKVSQISVSSISSTTARIDGSFVSAVQAYS